MKQTRQALFWVGLFLRAPKVLPQRPLPPLGSRVGEGRGKASVWKPGLGSGMWEYVQGQASGPWGGPQSRLSCPPPTSVAESWALLGLVETVVVNLAELMKVIESRL